MDRTTGADSVTASKVCTAAEIVEMQRLARAVPIAPHVTAYAVSVLAATHPDQPRAPGLVRDYVRYGGSPRGAQALVTARQDLRPARRPLQRLDRRHPGRRPAVAAPPDHPQLRGRGRRHHDRGDHPVHPRRGRRADRRVASQRSAATAMDSLHDAAHRRDPAGLPAERGRPDRLRRGVPAPARAPPAPDAVAGPRRTEGRPAERQARPVGRVRGLSRLHPRRRPAPARLERLRPPRAALREALRRGGGRHRHPPHRCLGVDGDRSSGEAAVREACGRRARLHRAGERGSGRGQRAVRTDRATSCLDARLGPRLPAPRRPVRDRACRRPDRSGRRGTTRRGATPRPRRRHPRLGPARPRGRQDHPRARRDGLGAGHPARPVARRARSAARGRPPAGRRRDRRGHRRDGGPGHARRVQGAPGRLEGRLRRPRGQAPCELRRPLVRRPTSPT